MLLTTKKDNLYIKIIGSIHLEDGKTYTHPETESPNEAKTSRTKRKNRPF